MTLKDLLTTFREKFPARNDCTSKVGKHDEYCQGCIEIIVEEPKDIESFLQENIEKMVREAIGEDEEYKKFTYPVPLKSEVDILKGYIARGRNELRNEIKNHLGIK